MADPAPAASSGGASAAPASSAAAAPASASAGGSTAAAPAPASGASGSTGGGGGGSEATTAKTTTTAPAKKKSSSSSKKKTVTKASGTAGTQAKAKKPSSSSSSKRKKPASKATSTASNQAIINEARAAQLDLQQQLAQAAARKSDPLWYRMEDVLPAVETNFTMVDVAGKPTPSSSILPEQSQIIEAALSYNGLQRSDVTPQAMACLLEQIRRYAVELITDANDYAYSTGRTELARADLLLAAELRADHPVAVSVQLPKLNLVANQVNRAPLPPIPSHCFNGVLLPPKEHQLTARTYDIVSSIRAAQKMTQATPAAPSTAAEKTATTPTTKSSTSKSKKSGSSGGNQGGYGASRGRQIPIKLKSSDAAASSASGGGS